MNVVTMSVITASVTILRVVRLSIIMQNRYNVCYAQFHFAECRYTEYFAIRILNKNKKARLYELVVAKHTILSQYFRNIFTEWSFQKYTP
jgi:hypothetical protein